MSGFVLVTLVEMHFFVWQQKSDFHRGRVKEQVFGALRSHMLII